jgi:hypothetical protein
VFTVPIAARFAGWLNAWLAHRESSDAVISGMVGSCAHVDVRGLADGQPLSPALLLGELRRLGVEQVSACLPRPGHPLGLGGPSDFNLDALDAGQAVVLHGSGLGLLPTTVGHAVHWRAAPACPPSYLPDVSAADRELRSALLEASDQLAELDVSAWSPDAADALLNLRAPIRLDAPMALPSGVAARAFTSGLRTMEIVRLATRDEGGSVSAHDARCRRDLLAPLERASRTAVVAACSWGEDG